MSQPINQQYQPSLTLIKNEARQIESNWGQYCRQKSVTVSSSSWETSPNPTNCLTLSAPSLTSNTATVIATANSNDDSCYVDNIATMSNGEVLKRRFPVYTE